MAQTGVLVKWRSLRWLKIDAKVDGKTRASKAPDRWTRMWHSGVSGRRLCGWAASRYGTPAKFFKSFFVYNYCPLAFMGESGVNLTPDKLPARERDALYAVCDRALLQVAQALTPMRIIGVGEFAEKRARVALHSLPNLLFGKVLHPSPASPAANKGWEAQAEKQLREMGIELPS